MRKISIVILFFLSLTAHAQKKPEAAIEKLLQQQTSAWNQGHLEQFMGTYWKNDSLMFIGKNGVTLGWENTLKGYKKSYPDKEAMGNLSFQIIKINFLSNAACFVVGKWMLQRTKDDVSGHFTLLIRKINGAWKIVADHSS